MKSGKVLYQKLYLEPNFKTKKQEKNHLNVAQAIETCLHCYSTYQTEIV
jgi:hypothetical protein